MKWILILLVLNKSHTLNSNVNSFWDTEHHCKYVGQLYKQRSPDKVMGYICQPAQEVQIPFYSTGDNINEIVETSRENSKKTSPQI